MPSQAPSESHVPTSKPLPGAPIKDANPPEVEVGKTPAEVPKVGSRDAPGG